MNGYETIRDSQEDWLNSLDHYTGEKKVRAQGELWSAEEALRFIFETSLEDEWLTDEVRMNRSFLTTY
jgi:hypothetical protein